MTNIAKTLNHKFSVNAVFPMHGIILSFKLPFPNSHLSQTVRNYAPTWMLNDRAIVSNLAVLLKSTEVAIQILCEKSTAMSLAEQRC